MFLKLVVFTLIMASIYSGLLIFRQQRLEAMNQSAVLHHQIMDSRQELWEAQTQLSMKIQPHILIEYIQASQLALEPAVPVFEMINGRLAKKQIELPSPFSTPVP